MKVKKYIKEVIDKHQKEFNLYFDRYTRIEIEKYINNGTYSFQLIYTSGGGSGNLVYDINPLDYKLCIHEESIADTFQSQWKKDKMWSYDGGQRYQWSEMETLIFDPAIIRNIKIESIL